jgi:hypothetical protein
MNIIIVIMINTRYVKKRKLAHCWSTQDDLYFDVSFIDFFRRVKGRLNLCSGSLIFDPDDTRLPITKFPYRLVEMVKEYKGPIVAQLPTKADMFAVRSRGTIRMKENNVNAPYVQTTVSS